MLAQITLQVKVSYAPVAVKLVSYAPVAVKLVSYAPVAVKYRGKITAYGGGEKPIS